MKLIMIGAEWCGKCTKAKQILKKFDIDYEYIDYDKDVRGVELEEKYGFEHLPFFLLVGDNNKVIKTEKSVMGAVKICRIMYQSDE